MKYIKTSKFDGSEREITRKEAEHILMGSYKPEAMFEILSTPNLYPTPFSYVEVVLNTDPIKKIKIFPEKTDNFLPESRSK